LGLYLINSSDPEGANITGVSADMTTFAMPTIQGTGFGFIEAAVELHVHGVILAAGLEANSTNEGGSVVTFAAVMNGTPPFNITSVQLGSAPPTGSLLNLQIAPTIGNTWGCWVGGQDLLNSYLPAFNGSFPVDTSIFAEWNQTPWVPQEFLMPHALEFHTPTGLYIPHLGFASWVGANASGLIAPPMKIAGERQNQSLGPGEFLAGTSILSPTNGATMTMLWNATATKPATLYGTVAPPQITGGQSVNVDWEVTQNGTAVPGVHVAFWSSLGGAVGNMVTKSNGWANCTYSTPVVQQPELLYLNASIENGTYYGSSNISFEVFPVKAIQLDVSMTPYVIVGAPSGMVELVVHVTQDGSPVAGVSILPEASAGGGAFSPYAPWVTDGAGYVHANYTVPDIYGNVTVWANVSSSFYAGSANATLVVNGGHAPGTSSSSSPLWPYAIAAVVVAVIVVIAMLLWAGKRKAAQDEADEIENEGKASSAKEPDKAHSTK
jgi:hypothetical protein